MVYGAEAVLPSDIHHDSPRVAACVEADNEKARQDAPDLLDEEHDLAAARSVIYQQHLRRYHSRRVKTRTFQEGDLVLQLIQDLLWSARICIMGDTILLTFETIRTHGRWRRSPVGRGI